VIENLFKVMAIKDEIYVAHLLTSKEKLERDKVRYNIDPHRGDSIEYLHLNRPQFTILGFNIEFNLNTRNWMLNLMKYCKFLRRWMPSWHGREKAYRDWYIGLVRQFNYFRNNAIYQNYVSILKAPESVNGYREIRYPKMKESQSKAEFLLSRIRSSDEWSESAPISTSDMEP
jgi:indolepyruvate ferredoxin oxidoreductase